MRANVGNEKIQVIVAAAGRGTRLGCAGPKALTDLAGKPLIIHGLERFFDIDLLENAIVAAPPEEVSRVQAIVSDAFPEVNILCVPGGDERQNSVAEGLRHLSPETEIVVIHDAARPFVTGEMIRESIEAAKEHGAATVAIPCVDTILEADMKEFLSNTLDRSTLWACQTPQTFKVDVIRRAHDEARDAARAGTDDASLVSMLNEPVKLVRGSRMNIKITNPEDMMFAEYVLRNEGAHPSNSRAWQPD